MGKKKSNFHKKRLNEIMNFNGEHTLLRLPSGAAINVDPKHGPNIFSAPDFKVNFSIPTRFMATV